MQTTEPSSAMKAPFPVISEQGPSVRGRFASVLGPWGGEGTEFAVLELQGPDGVRERDSGDVL